MKRTLYLKFLTGYLIFGILGFILVSTLTHYGLQNQVQNYEARVLYTECTEIASHYAANYYNGSMELEELHSHLNMLSNYMNTKMEVIDTTGRIIIDSEDLEAQYNNAVIHQFDISDFGNKYYVINHFYHTFSEDYLTVFAPITSNYKVRGYVLIHKPMADISAYSYQLLNVAYITLLLIFLLAFIILLMFSLLIYRPIRRITSAAESYIDGDFSQKMDIHSQDELGHLAAAFEYMANELNTLEDDQRKFVSNVSHDFRSPLTSIKGYVEAILDGTIPYEMQDKYLNIILFETERLNKLTSSLLELNKYGSHGKTILYISSFDINYIIRMTALTFEGTCSEKHISIELILSGQNLYVTADMAKIQQVIYNLTDNAVKFSRPDSSITIETTEKNDKVFVSVKDTGIGIPKDSLKKIWERFYKTDLSRGKDKRGTGLGLSIVKEIIQAHNENINVISTENVGTEFIFTLSLSEEQHE